jgi:hypothetical protein
MCSPEGTVRRLGILGAVQGAPVPAETDRSQFSKMLFELNATLAETAELKRAI